LIRRGKKKLFLGRKEKTSTAPIFDNLKEKFVALPPLVASIFDGSTLFLGQKYTQLLPEKLHQYLVFAGFGALGGWCRFVTAAGLL
jgi:hypothetical protein